MFDSQNRFAGTRQEGDGSLGCRSGEGGAESPPCRKRPYPPIPALIPIDGREGRMGESERTDKPVQKTKLVPGPSGRGCGRFGSGGNRRRSGSDRNCVVRGLGRRRRRRPGLLLRTGGEADRCGQGQCEHHRQVLAHWSLLPSTGTYFLPILGFITGSVYGVIPRRIRKDTPFHSSRPGEGSPASGRLAHADANTVPIGPLCSSCPDGTESGRRII
jgi:hypothetical protein